MKPQPIAVAVADLHLSLLQPVCRADKDWLAVQAGYLEQLKEIAGDLPILCAGDIFDRWNAPPELINFALEHLPDEMLCVPGQHDLPLHRIEDVHRSGYGVLINTGKIVNLASPNLPGIRESIQSSNPFPVYGFGWEEEIIPPSRIGDLAIAVIHRYCWMGKASYPGAPETANVDAYAKALRKYDVAIFGDNHKSFNAVLNKCSVLNCGTFMRRKSDEIDYEPAVGIIYSDGSIKRRKLDTSGDRFHEDAKEREETPFNLQEFIAGLEGLGEHGLNFREAVERHLKGENVDPKVKEIILRAMETT